MAYKQLYINGTGSGTYGIYINSDTYLSAPSFDYTEYNVPARNGALVQYNKRLNNIIRRFECFIPNSAQTNLDGFKKLLYSNSGYMRIESDYDTDTYQNGYLAEELSATPFLTGTVLQVTFDLYFSCEPQKYYKTNTAITASLSPIYIYGILPRNHPLIQKMLAEIPVGDVPNDVAFLVYGSEDSDNQTAVTALSASLTGYTGFMASGFIDYSIPQATYEWHKLIAYSTTGSITDTASHTPTVDSDVCVIVPAWVSGTISTSVTRGSTESRTSILSPALTATNSSALGLSYSLYMGGTISRDDLDLATGAYIRGSLGGAVTFEGIVSIDGHGLDGYLDPLPHGVGWDYNIDFSLNTETLNVKTKKTGSTLYSNGNAFTGVEGMIEGTADKVEVFMYIPFQTTVFVATNIKVTPRWWKV